MGVHLEISRIRPEFKVELPGSFLPLLPKAWRMTAAIGRLTVISGQASGLRLGDHVSELL